ncbi:MAG: acetyltransferase [Desulfotomaculales bacterium]
MRANKVLTVVIGAGGHAKVVLATLQEAGFTVDAMLDDDPAKANGVVCGVPVTGGTDTLKKLAGVRALVAVGDNGRRRELVARCEGLCAWISVVHPRAYVHNSVRIGRGTVVFAGARIQPDTVLGEHVIVNTGATVDHDCRIGDFVHIAPGVHLAGGVLVEEGALLGIGSVVLPGLRIGAWAVVGAGAAVVENVPPFTTVVGVPARPLGKRGG